MSIYSGFGTRQQESTYNSLVENTIHLLQGRVVANIKNEPITDPAFKMQLLKYYDMLVKLETHKYLQPKFSEAIKDIVLFVIKEQISSPKAFDIVNHNFKELENLKKTAGSTRTTGFLTERSLTPTLPYVKFTSSRKNLTPHRPKKNNSGFLFARLKNN